MSVEDGPSTPFVGPAGRILDKALDAAGIGRDELSVTNAVKHFKFTVRAERGKRRIHQTPSRTEAVARRPWLLAELDPVEPDLVLTVHPSSIHRGPPERRDEALSGLVDDLRFARSRRNAELRVVVAVTTWLSTDGILACPL